MQYKVQMAELREALERERRDIDRQTRQRTDNLLDEVEALRAANEKMQARLYKRETEVRLLQQKIREEEKSKHDQIEFSQTLCNVRFGEYVFQNGFYGGGFFICIMLMNLDYLVSVMMI